MGEWKRYDFWGQVAPGPTGGGRGFGKELDLDKLHQSTGSRAFKKVHALWETKYGRKKARELGAAAVAVLSDSARRKARKKSTVWKGIADSIKFSLHRPKKKGTMQVVVTVNHVAAMMKQYGGFIRAGGPFAVKSPRTGKKSKFIAIPLRGGGTKGVRLGNLPMEFRKKGDSSYDRNKLQSAPLIRFAKMGSGKKMQIGGMWKVSEKEIGAWRRKTRLAISKRGVAARAAKKDDELKEWLEKQNAYYGLKATAKSRKTTEEGVSDYIGGMDDSPAAERPWVHARYGDMSIDDAPNKILSDRSRWVKGLAPQGRMSSALKAFLGNADKMRLTKKQRLRFMKGFLETARLVFTKTKAKAKGSPVKIKPMYILVKAQYIPADPWIPEPEELTDKIWAKMRGK